VPTVALIGTLDTKAVEYQFLKERVVAAGCEVVVIDTGVIGEPGSPPDVTSREVAAAAGQDLESLRTAGRGAAVTAMGRGAGALLSTMAAQGRVHGAIGMGGSGGSSIVAAAMQSLPIGFPKVIVSTMASGDTRAFVGSSDVTLINSVVDISGLNRVLRRVLSNAAVAVAAMAQSHASTAPVDSEAPVIGATMFGVTSTGVTIARRWLEERGYEVLVFHANGAGGRAMEALMHQGVITGALDVTTTELVDELVGGNLSAGPQRLEVAGALGLPQVVSLGALDMANFGPLASVPERYRGRRLNVHNPAITLMRTTPEECGRLGEILAGKLNAARGPVAVFIPKRGVSSLSVAGADFHDPDADAALFGALRAALDPLIQIVEADTDINDAAFAVAMAECADWLYRTWRAAGIQASEQGRDSGTSHGGRGGGDERRQLTDPARRAVSIE
jgi:uncharacterized protein (UPF0261 family)